LEEGARPVDLSHPDNAAVLAYLQSENVRSFPPFFHREEEDRWFFFWRRFKPERLYGAHPDASFWLFDKVAPRLPGSGHRIVYGRHCLIHPNVGLILGFCQGMCYALRFPEQMLPSALAAVEASHEIGHPEVRARGRAWARTVRGIGPCWVPGTFGEEQPHLFGEAYDTCDRSA
ncbi:MAG: hypothetical protein MI919_24130, partial [Holophagales bacterium]|nr:hypothetical protein [Holophagales bacterium]